MDLQGLDKWFHDNAKRINTDKQGAYWQLRRDGNQMVFNNNHVGEVSESWELLEWYVNDQLRQGAKMLKVYYKNEPKAKNDVQYMIKTAQYGAPPAQHQQGQAGIGGLPGYASPQIGELYQQLASKEVEALREKYESQIAAIEQQHKTERQLEALEDQIHAVREEKKTSFDRLMEALEERPAITDKIVGALAPAIQGVLTGLIPARAQVAVQGPISTASVPAPQQAPTQTHDMDDIGIEGQQVNAQPTHLDFNASSQALITLTQAGFPNAGDDILRLAECVKVLKSLGYDDPVGTFESLTIYARENPDMAKSILSNLK